MHRTDGGIVDAELLRPRSWIKSVGIEAGKQLPLNIPELQVHRSAVVTSIGACAEIAEGEGSVVTARFITREVHTIARVEILGPDGQIETITGTTIHPIWSEDRQDWVPLGELLPGEQLRSNRSSSQTSNFELQASVVLSLTIASDAVPVYNIELHGEHVYQVSELGVLVHNSTSCIENVVASVGSATKPIIRSGVNRTIEGTTAALAGVAQKIKGTISGSRADARKLAEQVAAFEGIKNANIVEHLPAGGKLAHFHIEEMHWWHFWY